MEVVDPKEFVSGEAFRETPFRDAVKKFDWTKFRGKPVLVQGCASVTLPTWAYLVITAELVPYAKSISYGELKSPIPIFGQLGAIVP